MPTVMNPATGEAGQTYREMEADEVNTIIEACHEEWTRWRKTSFAERAEKMRRAGMLLRERQESLARLMAVEMGKPLAQGRAEAEKCAWVCDYYADNAEAFLASQTVETDAGKSYVAFQPIGVVLAVMPWNFPFWQVFRFATPALMAGNGGILKHASNVPGCALAIEDIFRDAGFPQAIFRSLLIASKMVKAVIEHPRVMAVTLTGSTPAGQAVASQAGAALKKTVLELGGSDPYLVLEDADLELAAATCANSRLINGGQSCIAAKRFIVVESVRQRFESLFVGQMRAQKMGNPLEEGVQIGPQARTELRDELHEQVERSIQAGARLLLGGKIPDGAGAYYPPTVLTNVKKGMAVYEEETFGPVAAIIPVKDEAEAIEVANDSVFGLGAAVFTQDVERGERIAREELQAGSCFVNALVKSDPRLPFGGIKTSGYGRELADFGIREFVNIKTVYIK
jgi:succinate-semialdehyde dehydrogenase/glutarate-semialdehyde dehydrogenase